MLTEGTSLIFVDFFTLTKELKLDLLFLSQNGYKSETQFIHAFFIILLLSEVTENAS